MTIAILIATAAAGLLSGAALYVSLVEHPARVECGPDLAVKQFGPSYRRAAVMQGVLAVVALVAGFAAWYSGASTSWLVGALILGAMIPFTLVVIMPTNRRLLEARLSGDSTEVHGLLSRWGWLHAVRTVVSVGVFLWFVAIAASLLLAGRSGAQDEGLPQEPTVTLPAPLARVLTDYEIAWRSKDAAELAALFAEDGFVLSSGAPPVRGRLQIQKHYTGQGGPLALRALAFAAEGSAAYIIGAYARQAGQPDIGKFTLTLREGADGRWLIMSDMDNGNSRPE